MNYWIRPAIKFSDKTLKDRMMSDVCRHFRIQKDDLTGKSREHKYSEARRIVGYILVKRLFFTTIETARILNRDHSTVVHYCRRAKELMDIDEDYRKLIYKFI